MNILGAPLAPAQTSENQDSVQSRTRRTCDDNTMAMASNIDNESLANANEAASAALSATHDKDDNHEQILQEALRLYEDDKVLYAARLLQSINSKYFEAIHHHIIHEGAIFQQLLEQSSSHHHKHCTRSLGGSSPKDNEWIKQGERHGKYNFCIYYKISKENHLTCRIETPIAPDMLVPLLSVLVRLIVHSVKLIKLISDSPGLFQNESELYQTWIPQYKVPKFEVTKSESKLVCLVLGLCGKNSLLNFPISTL
jgi:hypothetical protein